VRFAGKLHRDPAFLVSPVAASVRVRDKELEQTMLRSS